MPDTEERLEGWINSWKGATHASGCVKGYMFISHIKSGDEIEEFFAHASDCLFPITFATQGRWVSFVPSTTRTGNKPVAEKVKLLEIQK